MIHYKGTQPLSEYNEEDIAVFVFKNINAQDKNLKGTIVNQTCHSINRAGVTWISIYSPFNEFYLHGQGSSNTNDNSSLVKVNSDKERSFSDVDMISRIHNLCRIKMTDLNM